MATARSSKSFPFPWKRPPNNCPRADPRRKNRPALEVPTTFPLSLISGGPNMDAERMK